MNLATEDLARERRRDLLLEASRRRLIAEAGRSPWEGSARPPLITIAASRLAWVRLSWPR